jgi:hypothetical protein
MAAASCVHNFVMQSYACGIDLNVPLTVVNFADDLVLQALQFQRISAAIGLAERLVIQI